MENNMSAVKQMDRISSKARAETYQLEALCQRLLRAQPESESLLQRLLARSRRVGSRPVFALIQDGRCSACNMMVAIARIQRARAGEFINCAHCITFLYYE